MEDLAGMAWVTDPNEAFRGIGQPRARDHQSPGRSGSGRRLLIDKGGSLWVATRGAGIMRVPGDASGLHPERIEHLTRRQGLISDELRALFQDQDGTLWIGSRRGLSRLSESNIGSASNGRGSESFVAAVAVTRDGAVWTATAAGLMRELSQTTRTFTERDGLPSPIVTALHEDQRGTLWAATSLGVARLVGERFVALATLPGAGPNELQIRSMSSETSGALWLCDISRGLFRWKDGVMERRDEQLGPRKAYVVYVDRSDRVWVGLWGGGISVYDRGSVSTYSREDGLPDGTVHLIFESRSGAIWVGTERGLGRVEGRRVHTFATNGLSQSAVVSMVEDQADDLWVGFRRLRS